MKIDWRLVEETLVALGIVWLMTGCRVYNRSAITEYTFDRSATHIVSTDTTQGVQADKPITVEDSMKIPVTEGLK